MPSELDEREVRHACRYVDEQLAKTVLGSHHDYEKAFDRILTDTHHEPGRWLSAEWYEKYENAYTLQEIRAGRFLVVPVPVDLGPKE